MIGDGSIAPSKPAMRLTSRLSMDLAAFFGGGHKAKDHSRASSSSGIREPQPPEGDSSSSSSRPPVGLAKRISMDISAFFGGGGGHKAKEGSSGDSPAGSQGPSRRASKLHMGSNASLGRGGSGDIGAHEDAAVQPPLAPRPPPGRRSSVDFVRNLFRRSSVDAPALQQAAEAAAVSVDRTAQSSRFVTAESLQQSLVPSPLLSTCATARTSWSDAEGANGSPPSSDLVARGAAAAAAYLEAATKAVADKEAVLSLCASANSSGSTAEGTAAAGSTTPATSKSSFLAPVSLSGGVGGADVAGSGQGASGSSIRGSFDLCSPQAGAGGEARSSFEQIWSRIQTGASAAGAAASTQQQQDGASAGSSSSTSSSSKPSEPQQPAKPKALGLGELGFAPGKPALVTAADISSSSGLHKSPGSKSFKTPKAAAAAAAVDEAAGIAVAASSSFFTTSAPVGSPSGSPSPKPAGTTSATAATAPAGGLAVAASTASSFFSPTAAPPPTAAAAAARRPGSSSPLNLVGSTAVPSGTSSPSLPSRQNVQSAGVPAWGPGSPPKSPQPPKDPSNSSGRTGSRQNLLARQGGKKSVDMRDDVAAAFAVTAATTAAAAAAESVQQGLKAGTAVRPASGRSSVSQRLAVARRMAATAGAEDADDGEDGASPKEPSAQLDGSLKRHIASSSITNPGRTSKEKGQSSSTPAAAAAAARPSVLHGSAVQGRKGASLAGAELAPLRPSSGSRTAWVAEPLGKSLKAPTPTAGSTATPGGTVGGKGGRGSTTPTKTLPELGGFRAPGGSGHSGPVSPVGGFIGSL
jgi:hypothetical protein